MVPPDVILTNSSDKWLISHKIISNINSLCFYLFNKLLYKSTKFLKNYAILKSFKRTTVVHLQLLLLPIYSLQMIWILQLRPRYHLIIELALVTLLVWRRPLLGPTLWKQVLWAQFQLLFLLIRLCSIHYYFTWKLLNIGWTNLFTENTKKVHWK